MIKVIGGIFPQFGEVTRLLEDPDKLHHEVEQIYRKLGEALEFDHRAGFGSDECLASDSIEGSTTSREMFGRGNDRDRKINVAGNVDGPVPEELPRDASADSRHEAEIQGREGNQWTIDESYQTIS